MSRVICRLVAPLVRLSFIASAPPGRALICFDGDRPSWAGGWLERLLKGAGYLKRKDEMVALSMLGTSGRARLARASSARVEFVPGSFSAFRARVLREVADWEALAARAVLGHPA